MASDSATMLDEVHVTLLNVANPSVGFPYVLGVTGPNSIPAVTDLTLVVGASLKHMMHRPDGEDLENLPVSIVSQTADALAVSYIFRAQDLHSDPTRRHGWYWGYLKGELQDGTPFETREVILPVVQRFGK